ncbi:GldG family protein [Sulfidibacter corallicola]|uniref:GldG family protein n=1 Tax=Sulfidibacter corallicola TaxID=2818388 RepID=A0A8A4TSQ4_SULCO|nr:GldG family protein [Sulfidibacter corallicola]QTD52989.1 GldG family protein [Sulfidibacter corallicola]
MLPSRSLISTFAQALALAAVLIAVGWGLQRVSWRWDLTEDRLYTLNQTSLDLVDQLESPLEIRLLLSGSLPPRLRAVAEHIRAMVDQYAAHGGDRVRVIEVDPDGDDALVAELKRQGIAKTNVNLTDNDRVEMREIWFGMTLTYEGRTEKFPSMGAIENLEYDISGAILRLLQPEHLTVALVGPAFSYGQGTHLFTPEGNMKRACAELAMLYDVRFVPIVSGQPLELEGVSAVFAWGLHYFEETHLYQLDQYMMQGFPVTLLVSGVDVDPVFASASPRGEVLADRYLAHWGLRVGRDLVSDYRCTKVKYTATRPPVLKDYYLFPELLAELGGLGREFAAHRDLSSLVVPWPCSLTLTGEVDLASRVIGQTSDQAWLQKEPFVLDPANLPGPTEFSTFPIGYEISGRPRSFFAGPPEGYSSETAHLSEGPFNRVLVWSSEHMLTQVRQGSTLVWLSQTANYMTKNHLLAGIDRREQAFRPIRTMDADRRASLRWQSVLYAPAIVLGFVLLRGMMRRSRSVDAYRAANDEADAR